MLTNTNIVGAVSEAMVIAYLGSLGCEVFSATQSHSRADLVYIHDNRTVKVQVKTASWSRRFPHDYEQCRLVRKGINTPYTEAEIDELWVVGTHLWCFPVSEIKHLTSIALNSTHPDPRKTVRSYNTEQFVRVRGSLARPFRTLLSTNDPQPFRMIENREYLPSTVRAMKYKERK